MTVLDRHTEAVKAHHLGKGCITIKAVGLPFSSY